MEKEYKVVALLGSPRKKGNSAMLANQIIKGAESNGAVVDSFYLNRLNINPCQGCYGCQKPDAKGCVYVEAHIIGMVYGSAESPGEIASNATLMTQAEELGKKLMG